MFQNRTKPPVKVAIVVEDGAELTAVTATLKALDAKAQVIAVEADGSSTPSIDQAIKKARDADVWMATKSEFVESDKGTTKKIRVLAHTKTGKECSMQSSGYPVDQPFPVNEKARMMEQLIRNIMQNRKFFLDEQRGWGIF